MFRLTKRSVEGLTVGDAEAIFWDKDIAGFGIRVSPKGRKAYFIQYRSKGRTRRMTLGRHGIVAADQARHEAKKLLGEVAHGSDPSHARHRERATPTIEMLCTRFLNDYAAQTCKPLTIRDYTSIVKRCINPFIGKIKVTDVTRSDLLELQHKLKRTPYQANRAISVLSKIFHLAEDWGYRPEGTNPARRIKKFREEEKKRYLSEDEQARLGEVLVGSLKDGSQSQYVVAAIFLLMFTGCRLSEILTLKWDYVCPQHLELPDSKTGKRRIPFPAEARAVIDALDRDPENEYVICGGKKSEPLINLQKPWRKIRAQAGIEDVRIHDLRHTYASVAVKNGIDPFRLKEIMGHRNIHTTLRYVHLDDETVLAAAGSVASRLASALKSAPATLRIVRQ